MVHGGPGLRVVTPDLSWIVGRRSIGWGGPHTRAAGGGGGQRRPMRDGGGPPRTGWCLLEIKLESSACNTGGLKMKRGEKTNCDAPGF
jgi:hypothetical protein